ncbi:hypothetical protein POM88_012353 [Heracleum sosnowskyi]|uniref:Uncharacterized protein n=1 Tax=Heracleum sosnowskyi TaxID=360622 RepID=A0AAD8IZT1_9APIA|nr:hypothetical protein POM88_012353 [Heracleum sosnowskyi]
MKCNVLSFNRTAKIIRDAETILATTDITSNMICSKCYYLPVTKAFCNCPLNPVAQGLTADTLLLRQKYMPLARSNNNAVPPKAAGSVLVRCFLGPGLLLGCPGKSSGYEDEGGGRRELGGVTFGFCATEGEGEGEGDEDEGVYR